MKPWIEDYLQAQKRAQETLPREAIGRIVDTLYRAGLDGRQIFAFGNGGSGANASHFATDLGKGAADALQIPFRVTSLNDNGAWITAIANDYHFEDVFVRQLDKLARPGDVALTMSVSGNSPNVVNAIAWAKKHGLQTIALVGAKGGRLRELADQVIVVDSEHYGRVEDIHMTICHILCYAFMERAAAAP